MNSSNQQDSPLNSKFKTRPSSQSRSSVVFTFQCYSFQIDLLIQSNDFINQPFKHQHQQYKSKCNEINLLSVAQSSGNSVSNNSVFFVLKSKTINLNLQNR